MTGRETLVVLRGLETSITKTLPDLFQKLAKVAHELTRLETQEAERHEALGRALATQTEAQARAGTLEATAKTLTAEIAAEREAARQAWEAEAAERTAALDAVLTQKRSVAEEWTRQATRAEAQHDQRIAEMRVAEQALMARVAALRAHVEQMLRSAEAVLR